MKLKLKEGVQKFRSAKIWESMKQNLLVVEIDRNLIFDECVLTLFKKAKKRYIALRLSNCMTKNGTFVLVKLLANSSLLITYQFGCFLIE